MLTSDYRPANIEFDVDGGQLPMTLGIVFESANDAVQFMGRNLIGIGIKVRANRYMDGVEKNEIRREYQELLEQKIPMLEKELAKAKAELDAAKKAFGDASEHVSATTNEAKALAVEVRRGTKEMELDDSFTWRIAVGDRYYFYTFIDKQIKLCKVQDVPFHERQDLYNATTNNADFFNTYYPDGLMDSDPRERPGYGTGAPLKDAEAGNDVPGVEWDERYDRETGELITDNE